MTTTAPAATGCAATVRVVVVQGPLSGHLPRRVWLCHLADHGLMPGCSSGGTSMPLFVPEECLTVTGRGVGEQIQIIEEGARP